jgi:hypothetical protein
MNRRELIALFSIAATWPQVARAQARQLPLIGILAPDRPPFAGYDALLESLHGLGQIEGSTHVRETRWAEGQRIDLYRQYAKELVGATVKFLWPGLIALSADDTGPRCRASRYQVIPQGLAGRMGSIVDAELGLSLFQVSADRFLAKSQLLGNGFRLSSHRHQTQDRQFPGWSNGRMLRFARHLGQPIAPVEGPQNWQRRRS